MRLRKEWWRGNTENVEQTENSVTLDSDTDESAGKIGDAMGEVNKGEKLKELVIITLSAPSVRLGLKTLTISDERKISAHNMYSYGKVAAMPWLGTQTFGFPLLKCKVSVRMLLATVLQLR